MMTKHSPLRSLALAILANLALAGVAYFVLHSWAGWTSADRTSYPAWVGIGLPFIQFMAVAFLCDRLFRVAAERLTRRHRVPKLGLQVVSVLVYFAFLGSSVSIVFGESVGAILAASGIVGLAVGFALRGLLADVFSGIALHLDASLCSGNWIDITLRGKEYSGRLVDIQWRTVVLADRSENHVLIPNSEFATACVVNRSLPGPATEFGASLAIGSQYERPRVMQILENALARAVSAGTILDQPMPYVRLGGLDGATGALTYRMFYCLDLDRISPPKAQSALLSQAVDFLKAANIRLHPVRHTEWSRPAPPGQYRFSEASARLSVLDDVPLLSVLSQAELTALAGLSAVIPLSGGQPIMRVGDEGQSMFVVIEGRLAVLLDQIKVATLWPGECAGEMSLLTGSRRSADVVAEVPTTVLEIPKEALTPILQANPLQIERIAAVMAARQLTTTGEGGNFPTAEGTATDPSPLIRLIRRFFRLGG